MCAAVTMLSITGDADAQPMHGAATAPPLPLPPGAATSAPPPQMTPAEQSRLESEAVANAPANAQPKVPDMYSSARARVESGYHAQWAERNEALRPAECPLHDAQVDEAALIGHYGSVGSDGAAISAITLEARGHWAFTRYLGVETRLGLQTVHITLVDAPTLGANSSFGATAASTKLGLRFSSDARGGACERRWTPKLGILDGVACGQRTRRICRQDRVNAAKQ
jgi:hypothetical protein